MDENVVLRLKEVLDEKRVPVSAFARELGISQQLMNLYVRGERKMPLSVVVSFLEKYKDISPAWLMINDGDKYVRANRTIDADNSIVADNNHGSVTQNNGVDAGSSSVMVALKMFFRAMSTCGTDQEKVALMEELKGLVDTKK